MKPYHAVITLALISFGTTGWILGIRSCNRFKDDLKSGGIYQKEGELKPIADATEAIGNPVPKRIDGENTNYWPRSDAVSPNTNFITFATNRVHIEIGEGYHKISLYKFTDDEWNLITNYWQEYIVTNSLPMSYGGPIDHAPK